MQTHVVLNEINQILESQVKIMSNMMYNNITYSQTK